MPVEPPRGEEIYREEIPLTTMKFLVGFEVLTGLFFLGMALIQLFAGPVVSNAPPMFIWLLMAAVFFGVAWIISNFIAYRLTLQPGSLMLAFGRFRTSVRFDEIESYELDTRSSLVYGGLGFKVTRTRDGWTRAYTMIGKPKIGLKLKTGFNRHIIFSTDQPDTVMEILRERLKNAAGHVRNPF